MGDRGRMVLLVASGTLAVFLGAGFARPQEHTFTSREVGVAMAAASGISFRHQVIDPHPPQHPHVKAVGDISGDGHEDIVVASSDGGPLVWYQYPNWEKHVVSPSGKWSCDARVVDMDGDGDGDILIPDWYGNNRLEWYENPRPAADPAAGPWKRHIIGTPSAHDISLGDIDGDGVMEIVTRRQGTDGSEIVIWKRAGDDGWSQRVLSCPTGEGLAIGDLLRRGRMDIVIGDRWYEAPKDVMKDPWVEHHLTEWHEDAVVRMGDMNGDGQLDVVVTRSEGPYRLSWFEAPADPRRGGWAEHVVETDIDFAHSLVVCDLNGDGQPDIITAEMHQSGRKRVMVYLAERGGTAWTRQVLGETGSHNVCVARRGRDAGLAIVGANWSGDHQPLEMWEGVRSGRA